ncbi:MAG: divalent-cation tolerance protein CutA [Treponema sp.]|nr:divalent-cation tolerance protein CutA [Treponema sp.]
MNKENDYSIIIATTADKESARIIARTLVERRLAACAQMLPIESVYLWQGKVNEESEIALHIKSRTALFDEVKAAILEVHAYEVPEIVQIPITNGLPEYLTWIGDCTKPK